MLKNESELADMNVSRETTSLRLLVENRLRSAIATGVFTPGQRLIERELCEMTGVGRTSIREALRQLEAEGLVTTIPHRGPIVSTITPDEAEQLYSMRALLEGFAGRECARLRDPEVAARLRHHFQRLSANAGNADRSELLAAKTDFYDALLEGCRNVFVQRSLNMLLNRVTVLRITSMTRSNRIAQSLQEIEGILIAIEAGDEVAAEQACVQHIRNAAEVALAALRQDAAQTPDDGAKRRT